VQLNLTQGDIADLILQRTGTFIAWGGREALTHWMKTGEKAQLTAFLLKNGRVNDFVNAVFAEVAAEFRVLRPYVEELKPRSAVSIGPGLGFFEMQLYNLTRPELLLIDIEESAEHVHGYAQKGSGYSSLASCRNVLIAGGGDPARITSCNPRHQPLPPGQFDMIVSLISMGFHYPSDEYAAFITNGLRKGGLMILDRRAAVSDAGFAALEPLFDVVHTIPSPKSSRLILVRR
jgi:hypothetical protein